MWLRKRSATAFQWWPGSSRKVIAAPQLHACCAGSVRDREEDSVRGGQTYRWSQGGTGKHATSSSRAHKKAQEELGPDSATAITKDGTWPETVPRKQTLTVDSGATLLNKCPFKTVTFCRQGVARAHCCGTVDLAKSYWQVHMVDGSQEKTVLSPHRDWSSLLWCPLDSSDPLPPTREWWTTSMAAFCAAKLADLVIFSNSWGQHLSHINHVLTALHGAGLTAKPS